MLGFFVSPTAVRHRHQFIRSALVNAEREIGRALKTQVNHLIEKVAFFRAADFAPGNKEGGMPWPEEENNGKVEPFVIRTNFKHTIVIGCEPQDGALHGKALGCVRFMVGIRLSHAAPAANPGNQEDDGAPKKGEDNEKGENGQDDGDCFCVHG